MARLPRFSLLGYPQHVIQRGIDQQRFLFEEDDYWYLWDRLNAASIKFECELHAYVLMPNHFHLLLTPHTLEGIGRLMQYVGRYFVQYFNARYEHDGALWGGRYRATLLDPKRFLLPVSHYIEANPVRAGLVTAPGEYGWSSYGANARGDEDALVRPHPEYLRLGRSAKARRLAYTAQAGAPLADELLTRIRDTTNKSWVLGDTDFCSEIDGKINRRTSPRPRGGDRRSLAYRRAVARL